MEDNGIVDGVQNAVVINDCFSNVEGIYESVNSYTPPVCVKVSKEEYIPGSIEELTGHVDPIIDESEEGNKEETDKEVSE